MCVCVRARTVIAFWAIGKSQLVPLLKKIGGKARN